MLGIKLCIKGPYMKYVGEGAGGFLWAVLKYFRHILMSHEIFSKTFDGPRNILLCSIFIKELKHKISKLAIKEI